MATEHHVTAREGLVIKPLRMASILAAIYLVFCVIYIGLSSHLAARHAESVAELARIETFKGLIFVLVCSGLLGTLTYFLLRRIARGQEAILSHAGALLMAERRAMAGIFATSVAHDMNNILTVGVATTDLLRMQKNLTPIQSDMVGDLESTFTRMTDLTRRLSTLGRGGLQSEVLPADLAVVVRDEVEFARRHSRLRASQVQVQLHGAVPVTICAPMIQQMLVNLLVNAADASGPGGHIEVRVGRSDGDAFLEVHDSGPGVPKEERERIFDVFYTTKPQGLGLGLLSVRAAAQVHHGRITVGESPLGGACFRVTLPIHAAATA